VEEDLATNGKRNFLITGAGSGFGRALANAALSSGHSVIVTVRSRKAGVQCDGSVTSASHSLDVTDFAAIDPIIAMAERDAGPIDPAGWHASRLASWLPPARHA